MVGTRVRRWVAGLSVAVALASGVGVAALWPTGPAPAPARVSTAGASRVVGIVVAVQPRTCAGSSADRLPDGSVPRRVSCPRAQVRVESGPEEGSTRAVDVPAQLGERGVRVGDRVDLARYAAADGVPLTYAWVDFSRRTPLLVVVGAFAVVVLAVGRWRGLAALVGLALAYGAILVFVVPALLRGSDPVAVSLCGSVGIMSVVLYLAHGFSLKTATAHLGTALGLVLTAVAAPAVASWTHLQGLDGADSAVLAQLAGSATLPGLVVAGVVIAGLGVLNDVTISQASAVWELRSADPSSSVQVLLARALRIGRDHLASTVYTLAFAYAGSALPTLAYLQLSGQPFGQVATSSAIATEIVRTAVGGACLVVAIPVTTAVAAATVAGAGSRVRRGRRRASQAPRQ